MRAHEAAYHVCWDAIEEDKPLEAERLIRRAQHFCKRKPRRLLKLVLRITDEKIDRNPPDFLELLATIAFDIKWLRRLHPQYRLYSPLLPHRLRHIPVLKALGSRIQRALKIMELDDVIECLLVSNRDQRLASSTYAIPRYSGYHGLWNTKTAPTVLNALLEDRTLPVFGPQPLDFLDRLPVIHYEDTTRALQEYRVRNAVRLNLLQPKILPCAEAAHTAIEEETEDGEE
jgi:hypothetical protein